MPARRSLFAAPFLLSAAAHAQAFPTRPVRLVVPFAAGGPTDLIARLVAAQLEAGWGQPVVVENRPGAGGSTGSAAVARAAPDGHTLLVTANSHVINPAVLASLPFDTLRDFTPIIRLADGPFVLVAHPGFGPRDLPGMIATVRAHPGRYNYGSAGHGTGNHLAMERLLGLAGLSMTHVSYAGAAPATTALLAGEVQIIVNNLVNSLPHIRDGRMVPLAIGSLARQPVLPEVAPIADSFPGFTAENWYAVLGPAAMQADRADAIHAAAARAMRSDAVAERLRAMGITPAAGPRSDFARQIEAELAEWARVARAAGIRPG